MYWSKTRIGVDNKELPDGEFAPELWLTKDDFAMCIQYDHYALLGKPWCVMLPHYHNCDKDIVKRFTNFTSAYEFIQKQTQGA